MEMILILGFGGLLIFFMMNSRKKQRQQQEKLASGLIPGARVMTSFGVFGTVVDVLPEENKVMIEAGPGTILTVHRQAIGNIEEPVAPEDHAFDAETSGTQIPDDLSSLDTRTFDDELSRKAKNTDDSSADDADQVDGSADDALVEESQDSVDDADAPADADSKDSADTDIANTDTDSTDTDEDRR